ncbi:uncharacterized protein FPRO_15337 [Fusarium proliferatum ET1]|uniref:Uncharacterized protein n=1 Tax=Fusarium proliferatum (strain ET1) TaxID=1227346 RepID=A0A1L7VYH2_FUSPR|nr:uncharacterized protein FPRO_15337 [Fusarium proliferatum ET1]CZR45487.1 uncharacterized protein FPRO_15337 [Fusarium proliferatum ET1]
MKFTLPTAAFALSLLGAADGARIETYVTTGPQILTNYSSAYFGDDGEMYPLGGGFRDGCRKTKYDWVKEICIDDGKLRAHIVYSGGTKKCFKRTKDSSKACGGSAGCWQGVCQRCWTYVYTETKCTW